MTENEMVKSIEESKCPVCKSESYTGDPFFGDQGVLWEFKCKCGYVLATTHLETIIKGDKL